MPTSITEKFILIWIYYVYSMTRKVTHALLSPLPPIFKVPDEDIRLSNSVNYCCIVSGKMCSSEASHLRQKKKPQNKITKLIKLF